MKIWFCIARAAVLCGLLIGGKHFYMHDAVHVQLRLSEPSSGGVQVYYVGRSDEPFSEEKSISALAKGTPATVNFYIPVRELYSLRFDFGSAPGRFSILGGSVGGVPLLPWKDWSFSPDITQKSDVAESGELVLFSDRPDPFMFVTFPQPVLSALFFDWRRFVSVLALALALTFAVWKSFSGKALEEGTGAVSWHDRPVAIGLSALELGFLLLCAAYYTLWIFQPFNFSPDEAMRFDVTRFLFDHGRLPVNEETINSIWGISYAHLPTMFCNVFGALFMKAASLFTSDEATLLRAARMLGVLCITGTLYWFMRTSRILFKAPFNWLPVCIVAFLPQFAYIGSYVNNDSAALLGVSMILFAWACAMSDRWSYGKAVVLSIGIAICATSYYNSYAWILFSMPMFILTYAVRNGRAGMVRMGLFVSVLVLAMSGFLFLRHLYLYGDLLGFETSRKFALAHASPDFIPGVRKSLYATGCSLYYMLFGLRWLPISALSFVGYFGYMQYRIPELCYWTYGLLFCIGAVGCLWKVVDWLCSARRIGICKWAFLVSLVGCAAITIGLSMFYSYTMDFQAQGRYCFPALLPVALFAAKGFERIVDGAGGLKLRNIAVVAVCSLLGFAAMEAYFFFSGLVDRLAG